MSETDSSRGSQAAYDFWLGLIPQFLGQFGGAIPAAAVAGSEPPAGLPFPLDQIARAAGLTQQSLQAMALWLGPAARPICWRNGRRHRRCSRSASRRTRRRWLQ
jgi:hypothetical protein